MDVVTLFKKLLQFRSITPNDDGAFDFIASYLGPQWELLTLDSHGVKNRFFYRKFTEGQHLCFAGHIDVVPPGEGWLCDPFAAYETGDAIIARGAQDMKSGVSAFLHACKNTTQFCGTLSILLTSDEEGEAVFGTKIVLEHLEQIGLLPSCVIVAEPTCEVKFGDTIKIGRRGSINGFLEVFGIQGHAGYPNKCKNPVDLIAPILPNIAGIELDHGDSYFEPSRFVITDLRAGMQVTNVTPAKLSMMFNIRNGTKTGEKEISDFIEKHFQAVEYTYKLNANIKPFLTQNDSKIVTLLSKTIEKILNITPKRSTSGGTSDARFFGLMGIPTVEFGVINDTIHAVNEQTTKTQVEKLAVIFQTLIQVFK